MGAIFSEKASTVPILNYLHNIALHYVLIKMPINNYFPNFSSVLKYKSFVPVILLNQLYNFVFYIKKKKKTQLFLINKYY